MLRDVYSKTEKTVWFKSKKVASAKKRMKKFPDRSSTRIKNGCLNEKHIKIRNHQRQQVKQKKALLQETEGLLA